MANSFLGLDTPNIMAGWGGPPQLHAGAIGDLVSSILKNRQFQQEYAHRNIADAIKQYQQQRESSAYTDALQKAKLLPEGDYGGLGMKGGASLAVLIAKQNAEAAKEAYMKPYYEALTARAGRGGGGGGDGESDTGGPEIIEHNGIQYQVIRTRNGVRYQRVPYQRPSTPSREERENIAPTMADQTVYPDEPTPAPSSPPSSAAPSDTAGGHAQDYGKPVSDEDVKALGWARAHPDDPRSAAILDKLGIPH